MTSAISQVFDKKSGIARLIFDLPNEKVNKLSTNVLEEFEQKIDKIANDDSIKILLIISNKEGNFIAGADINEIKSITKEEQAKDLVGRGQKIITKLADLKIPTIAIISGACLGGGLELALACNYRLATTNSKTLLGLPEVNLGIIPGFGGTQRLPKLIGLEQSFSMILSGKSINAKKALKIGLVDQVINEAFLEDKITEFSDAVLAGKVSKSQKRTKLESIPFGKTIIMHYAFKSMLAKTKAKYPAPHYAFEVIRRTYGSSNSSKGLEVELEAFCELVVGKVCKNLVELFFTNESLKKDNGVNGKNISIKEIDNAAILGAGIMGGGIAWLFAYKDIEVRIKDITNNAIAIGYAQIKKVFDQLKKIRKITDNEIALKTAKVSSTLDYCGFKNVDIVVEAVIEDIEIKKKIFADLEKEISDDTIIASNTSSLSITEMSKALKKPKRFVGMHFFNPVNRMPLVEVIKGEKTDDKTIASTVALAKKMGKTPIVVKDVAGFLVNRILLPYLNEASYILQEGGDILKIDYLIEDFGMPMGPFILADVVGIDVGVKVAKSLESYYGSRMKVSEILNEIYENHKNYLGKKSKIGFYKYENKTIINSEIYKIVDDVRNKNNLEKFNSLNEDIIDRCIYTMINEAAKCLEEEVVENASYLDMAMIMGAGFPAFRGGVLRYADEVGINKVVERLKQFNDKFGARFEVSKLLVEMANNNKKFYD